MAKKQTKKKSGRAVAAGADNVSFEDKLAELEEIVRQLEDGEKPLDESIALYERGEKTRDACLAMLNRYEQRIKILQKDRRGAPHLMDRDVAYSEDPEELSESIHEFVGDGEEEEPPARSKPSTKRRSPKSRPVLESDELDEDDGDRLF